MVNRWWCPSQFQGGREEVLPPTPEQAVPPPVAADTGAAPRTYAEVAAMPYRQLQAAEFVYVRRGNTGGPLALPYSGPFRVLHHQEKVFDIQMGPRVEAVSVDRLKPHRGEAPSSPALPPARGRPPGTGGGSKSSPSVTPLGGGAM
jgi:hypothetical protein